MHTCTQVEATAHTHATHLAIGLDAVLQAVELPAGIADLHAGLADVDGLRASRREAGHRKAGSTCRFQSRFNLGRSRRAAVQCTRLQLVVGPAGCWRCRNVFSPTHALTMASRMVDLRGERERHGLFQRL